MARYVITHRLAGKTLVREHRAARKKMLAALGRMRYVKIAGGSEPEDALSRYSMVIEAEPAGIAALRKTLHRDVIVEPEILHKHHATSAAARERTLPVEVSGGGEALGAARVTILSNDDGRLISLASALTANMGRVSVAYPESSDPAFVLAEPAGAFWGSFVAFDGDGAKIKCPTLPDSGPLEWWHRAVGISEYDARRGLGIRIGVVGTGAGPHPCLRHIQRVDGKADVGRHDTHVCGILGARPITRGQFAGIAPGAEIFSACTFRAGAGAEAVPQHQGVFASAIDHLARPGKDGGLAVDLLNLSFGESQPSEILHDAVRYAMDHGVLCICSAGNNLGGALDFPAAFHETVAVSALGRRGWGPPGSITSHWVPATKNRFGQGDLFLAAISSAGKGVFCAAPGSGIISTMPARTGLKAPYAAMDGTSLACPMACGVLAALLAKNAAYQKLPRTPARARKARQILRAHCIDIGLDPKFQGVGMPIVR